MHYEFNLVSARTREHHDRRPLRSILQDHGSEIIAWLQDDSTGRERDRQRVPQSIMCRIPNIQLRILGHFAGHTEHAVPWVPVPLLPGAGSVQSIHAPRAS